jgi:hypothetical protein
MATVNFSVPEEVKQAFNAEFEGQNKSAIIADLMREAVERARRKQRSHLAVQRILERRPQAPDRPDEALQAVRRDGRP